MTCSCPSIKENDSQRAGKNIQAEIIHEENVSSGL